MLEQPTPLEYFIHTMLPGPRAPNALLDTPTLQNIASHTTCPPINSPDSQSRSDNTIIAQKQNRIIKPPLPPALPAYDAGCSAGLLAAFLARFR